MIMVRGFSGVVALLKWKQSFGMDRTAGLVLLTAKPEELLALHCLLDAVLENCCLRGHTIFWYCFYSCILLNFLQGTCNTDFYFKVCEFFSSRLVYNNNALPLLCYVWYNKSWKLFLFSNRLVFGMLYPAYYSYKAVKTKNVKEYVSHIHFNCLIKYSSDIFIMQCKRIYERWLRLSQNYI